jgi:hypothetical protein
MPVKGMPDPVDVYLLTGTVARTRLQASVARGLTRFVGRAPENQRRSSAAARGPARTKRTQGDEQHPVQVARVPTLSRHLDPQGCYNHFRGE